jgi:hypothetical protein
MRQAMVMTVLLIGVSALFSNCDALDKCEPQCDPAVWNYEDGCGGYCCYPDCEDRECGDDGCGGNCGVCPDGAECVTMSCTFEGGTCFDAEKECPEYCQYADAECGWVATAIAEGSPECECGPCPEDRPYCTDDLRCLASPN